MTVFIERLDGKRYSLDQLGIRIVEFEPESPNFASDTVSVDGGGYLATQIRELPRYINMTLRTHAVDMDDYALLRSEVFALLSSREEFYIQDAREFFKRWRVRVDGSFSQSRNFLSGTFSYRLLSVTGLAESIGTSIQLTERNFDAGLWGWGTGANDEIPYQYVFTTTSFTVHNVGTAEIDPRRNSLDIRLVGISTGNSVRIENTTTGDIFTYNKSVTANDVLLLSGVRVLKNNVSVFSDTNKKLLRLAPGENDFVITGVSTLTIRFNFRFLYK